MTFLCFIANILNYRALLENNKTDKIMKVRFFIFLIFLGFFGVEAEAQNDLLSLPKQLLVIHRNSRIMTFFENDSLVFTFRIRVGKKTTPTPLGEGYIYIKRERPIFRYIDPGPKQGQIVDTADCASGKKVVNYSKMRALGLHYDTLMADKKVMKKLKLWPVGERRYSVHSVTCEETIGQAVSNGCVGMIIEDMFKIYDRVRIGPNGARFRVLDD